MKTLLHMGDLGRMSTVKRWNILGDLPTQSIAEHSYNVAIIAARLCELAGYYGDGKSHLIPKVVQYALVHDFDEIFIGDIPTPTKNLVGMTHTGWVFESLGGVVEEMYSQHNEDCGMVGDMVKLADLIEAASYVYRHGTSEHHRKVHKGLEEAISNKAIELNMAREATHVYHEICAGSTTTIEEIKSNYEEV